MKLKNTRISTRLFLGFGLMATIMMLLGVLTLASLWQIGRHMDLVIHDRYDKITKLEEVKAQVNHIARALRNALIMTQPSDVKQQADEVRAARENVGKVLAELDPRIVTSGGRSGLEQLKEIRGKYIALQDQFLGLVLAGKTEEARTLLLGEVRPVQLRYFANLDTLIDHQHQLMLETAGETDRAINKLVVSLLVGAGVALVAAIVLALWIVRSVTRPLYRAVAVSRAVAAGDLSVEIEDGGASETGQLLAALRDMQAGLAKVVAEVRGNADSLATASTQIAQGNNDLSGRTEEQASALQQTAASMKQLTVTVRQNADNAREGNTLAQNASGVAARGGEVVGRVVSTMKDIDESSRRIADILGVIDGIAFQTNILALNAAVEAARAGEQGRGFAVVAGEVRTLAQRSADAAKEIKELITASVERVAHGSTLVDEAGATMGEVVQAIARVTDLMGAISAASEEQSTGVTQIGDAVHQMDQATQQNAALVEESAAAAGSLKSQARQLVDAVAVFKLAEGDALVPVAAPLASPPVAPAANTPTVHHARFGTPARPQRLPSAPLPRARTGTDDDDWQTF